jgi:predicted enzyme related to lactoylglutathione lyase
VSSYNAGNSFAGSNGKTGMENSASRFVWYELATTDMEAAKAFYANVLGWSTAGTSAPGSAYTLFTAGNVPIAGLMEMPAKAAAVGAPPQWIGYAGVDDVDDAASRAEKLGGTVHVPPADVPNVSRFSIVADPQWATFALIKGRERSHEGSARPCILGHVVWHELLAADLDKAFAFYSALFGWQKADARIGPMGMYQEFSAGADTIGGMFKRPGNVPVSLWLYYFNVNGIGAAAKRVERGGGQILDGPLTVPGGARIVHCRDPQGAIFALIDTRVSVVAGCYKARDPSDPPRRPGQ